jgi:C4-dicarboxylate-specific signal transduction histidine kinase
MIGVLLGALIDHDDLQVMIERTQAMLTRGERFPSRLYRARRRDGAPIVVEITSHVTDFDGAPAVLGFGRDVTERVRMQDQLARADRLAALGTLAAGVAHEINNPLAFVTLGVDTLSAHLTRAIPDPALRADLLARLEPIRTGAARVAEIVRDLGRSRGPTTDPRGRSTWAAWCAPRSGSRCTSSSTGWCSRSASRARRARWDSRGSSSRCWSTSW